MRVKITKDYKEYRKGQVVEVSRNVAFGLIDSGNGVISKDIVAQEVQVKNGNPSRLGPNKRR